MWKKNIDWLLPLILIIVYTPFSGWLDLEVSKIFYDMGKGNIEHFMSNPVLDYIYAFGVMPAWIVVIMASFALLLSYLFQKCRPWRPHALFLVLTLAVGSGFIVNGLLKEYWGRPRPKQVVEFGGQNAFRPYYKPDFFDKHEPKKSFSCGHCTMGFYFFTIFLIGRRFKKKWLCITGMALAWGLGLTLSLARIAQGGHFLSDVVFSALIMWYTALLFDWIVYEELT